MPSPGMKKAFPVLMPRPVTQLTGMVEAGKASSQEIANSLWALAKTSRSGIIHAQSLGKEGLFPVHCQGIDTADRMVEAGEVSSQEIANSLWALAKLAEQGIIHAQSGHEEGISSLIAKALTQLTGMMEAEKASSQEIATACGRWEKLAEQGIIHVQSGHDKGHFHFYCRGTGIPDGMVKTGEANSQDIANSLWALGKLADQGIIHAQSGHNDEGISSFITESLTQLTGMVKVQKANSQEIANSLWALGKLADQGIIHAQSLPGERLLFVH